LFEAIRQEKLMKLRFVLLLAFAALLTNAVIAHGDKKHVMGTLEKINGDSVVVKTADGKSVEVKLASATMYVSRDGKSSKLSDLAIGQRVVIHATPEGETLTADEIKFSPPGAATGASAAKPKP
jgi:hypothetical protein